jgi:Restriction endonuclease S subunits
MSDAWKRVKLGEICSFKYGQMPDKEDLAAEGYPVFSGYRIVGFSSRYHYENPEIIVVARGIGGTGDVKMSPPRCFLTNLSIAALVESRAVHKRFLYYRLAGTKLWDLRTGSAQAQITIDRLKDYEVLLPLLPTQHRIADILAAYDDLVENNTKRIKILEEMARSLYREWFVNFRFPGHEKTKFVAARGGKVPAEWEMKRLHEVAMVNARTIRRGEEPDFLDYVDIASVSPGVVEKTERYAFEAAPGRARRLVMAGDTIWSTVRPNRRSYAFLASPPASLVVSTGFAVLSAKSVPASFLHFFVTTDDFVAYLMNRARGAAYPACTGSDFEEASILVPTDRLAQRFDQIAAPMLQEIDVFHRKNSNLRATRDLLLPRLISGEIDVSSLPPEPAAS